MAANWPYVVHGDVEAAIVDMLSAATPITSFPGGAPTVSVTMNGYEMESRWIMVSREGGNINWPNIDKPRIDFNVYAESRSVAHNLAQVAIGLMFREMGTAYPSRNVVITDVKVETGLFRVPDKETGSPRYVFSLRLTCVPYSS